MNKQAKILATQFASYVLTNGKDELTILKTIKPDVPFGQIEKEYNQIIDDLINTARLWESSNDSDDFGERNENNSGTDLFHPNWEAAPGRAVWWAMDANGDAFWYEEMPSIEKTTGTWLNKITDRYYAHDRTLYCGKYLPKWDDSLRKRP